MGRLEAFLLAKRVLVEGDGQEKAKAKEELRQRVVQGQRADE